MGIPTGLTSQHSTLPSDLRALNTQQIWQRRGRQGMPDSCSSLPVTLGSTVYDGESPDINTVFTRLPKERVSNTTYNKRKVLIL